MGGSTSKEENKGTVGEQGTHNGPEFFPVHAPSAGGGGLFTLIIVAMVIGLLVLVRRAMRAKKNEPSTRRGRGARRRWYDYDIKEAGYWSAPEDIEMMPRTIVRPPMHVVSPRRPVYDDGRIYEVIDGAQGGHATDRPDLQVTADAEGEKDRVVKKKTPARRVTFEE